jgi:hypothetical protein
MLHLFHVRVDDQGAGRNERAGNLCGGGPTTDAADENNHNYYTGENVAPNGSSRW